MLENCSECDVKYKLFYIANKEPPLRHSSKGERVAVVGHCHTAAKSYISIGVDAPIHFQNKQPARLKGHV